MTAPDGQPSTEWLTAAPSSPSESRAIDAFRLLERIGEGGMGEVWLAEQLRPVRRQVAIKILKAGMDTAHVVARFDAERQALALMNHPAIATVFDGGATAEGRPYFAMEYVRGEAITSYCDRHQLSVRDRLALFVQVCDGVQHAHQKGIIHRDLKPSNILVVTDVDRPTPKIIDFGIAKATTQALTAQTLHTNAGLLLGTLEYMSPEQAQIGEVDVDTRTDVYALGVVLYELLTGVLPFERAEWTAKGIDEFHRLIRERQPTRPSIRVTRLGERTDAVVAGRSVTAPALARQLRGDLDWIVLKALAKERTRRYGSASDFATDVRRHLDLEPVLACPPSASYRAAKFVLRHRGGVAAAAMLAITITGAAIALGVQSRRIAAERDRANREAAAARQVSDFLVGLFRVSDPGEARGSTLTAREILDRGARQIDETLRADPQTQARLKSTIGTVYVGLGLYRNAVATLGAALETQRRVLGPDAPEALETMGALADAHWYLDELTQAESIYRELGDRRRRTLGAEHPATLKAQWDLSSVLIVRGRYTDAEPLAQSTLEAQRRVLPPDDPAILSSLNNLSSLYFQQGRYADAEPIAREVLAIRRRRLGDDAPQTLVALHNMSTVYEKLGAFDKAEPVMLEAVQRARRVLGERHPRTLEIELELGQMYVRRERFDDAEPYVRRAAEGLPAVLGPAHVAARDAVETAVQLYTSMGRPADTQAWRARQ